MVLTVSLLIIIARQLKGMVSVSQSLRRILGVNGLDIIPGPLELAHDQFTRAIVLAKLR